ncbi:MAG: hypothetical protein ACTSX6_06050 [Candidatus Heimdallarchaeaceae archaeon]
MLRKRLKNILSVLLFLGGVFGSWYGYSKKDRILELILNRGVGTVERITSLTPYRFSDTSNPEFETQEDVKRVKIDFKRDTLTRIYEVTSDGERGRLVAGYINDERLEPSQVPEIITQEQEEQKPESMYELPSPSLQPDLSFGDNALYEDQIRLSNGEVLDLEDVSPLKYGSYVFNPPRTDFEDLEEWKKYALNSPPPNVLSLDADIGDDVFIAYLQRLTGKYSSNPSKVILYQIGSQAYRVSSVRDLSSLDNKELQACLGGNCEAIIYLLEEAGGKYRPDCMIEFFGADVDGWKKGSVRLMARFHDHFKEDFGDIVR